MYSGRGSVSPVSPSSKKEPFYLWFGGVDLLLWCTVRVESFVNNRLKLFRSYEETIYIVQSQCSSLLLKAVKMLRFGLSMCKICGLETGFRPNFGRSKSKFGLYRRNKKVDLTRSFGRNNIALCYLGRKKFLFCRMVTRLVFKRII